MEIPFFDYCLTVGKDTELVGTLGYDFVSKGRAAAQWGITALTSHFEAQKEIFILVVYLSKPILSVTNVLFLFFSIQVHLFPALYPSTVYELWKNRVLWVFFPTSVIPGVRQSRLNHRNSSSWKNWSLEIILLFPPLKWWDF